MSQVKILLCGDRAISLEFGTEITPEISTKIRAFQVALEDSALPGIVETVPAYCSLMIYYDPSVIRFASLADHLLKLSDHLSQIPVLPSEVLEIPVLYGGEAGPDLDYVAAHNGLTTEEVIRIHSSREYLIHMLGFTPGFTYLGGMSDRIAVPRMENPRIKILAGSVGIAGTQTGIYPVDSPGGWRLIGRTPVRMYDPYRATPILPRAGWYIHFYPIDQQEYTRIAAQELSGTYVCKRHKRGERTN